ncbi:Cyclic nucleotide-binding domain-containing protein [Aquimarina amphilecti]|uniref:histidine kinase n=1 Tax=Aquimarina amphilecti TaxID=1038014 RepID=A0A1H7WE67_AQUAM|nr:ATP-binding protein [Aquimarina amphilecti]SEM19866.1 Cyclic nucleotide-binding domain-containing protein [Aquimarina amphilecti]
MKLSIENLQQVQEFIQIPDDQLQWLLNKAYVKKLKKGAYLFQKGDPIDKLFIVLEGKIEIKVEQNGNYKHVALMDTNEIGGLLPFSRASSALGFGEVIEDTKVLTLEKILFKEMISNHYELTEVLVHKMTSRVREFTKDNVQAEKMMSLGKLSAGLAHELNNPASAMVRSAKALKVHLSNVPEKFKRVVSIRMGDQEIDTINKLLFDKLNNRPENNMKLTERNEKEDELEEWLEDHGVDEAYELTETLLDFCMDIEAMENIYNVTGQKNFPNAIEWVENVLTTEKMVDEIAEASNRISSLVHSIKSYTHMDRAPEKTPTDIHIGIKSTLTMLNHKLKKKNISVEKDFQNHLPKVKIFVSEINQVWTNLIDNAVDAMDHSGVLKIKTYKDQNFLKTEIIDNGKGIPEENLNIIFDPFYTTKAIGEGTGMGLEVVQRIINQHHGDITVKSKKGETRFTVCIPLT